DVYKRQKHINDKHSVNLVGMKRVGINNFLKFFVSHPEIHATYLDQSRRYLFVMIDLNDLVERDIYPFWTLTLKRLTDSIEMIPNSDHLKKESKKRFVESIQLKDLFVTVDSVQKIIALLVKSDYYPVIIFNRFDRMKDAATTEFFGNLQSLNDHAERNISCLFTSYRPLYELKPTVFSKQALSLFCNEMYLKPAEHSDASIMLQHLEERYKLSVPSTIRDEFLSVTGGHAQYLHLSFLKLKESQEIPETRQALIELLLHNEEAMLQSEELLDSLTETERSTLYSLADEDTPIALLDNVPYLRNTGMATIRDEKPVVFSPLLRQAIIRRTIAKQNGTEFTKKEHLLFSYLKTHEGELCEREEIVEAVWPDYAEAGVSDWAIDRLVARVRAKLKLQQSPYEIQTVITRGYKLVRKS
ncbi:MAG: helix-turn-helix domain-containing protein, partial [Patescibacteria group bacterium]|nr:helix-turn-helix domain-containing protein [Patescibacteria group bacterium]